MSKRHPSYPGHAWRWNRSAGSASAASLVLHRSQISSPASPITLFEACHDGSRLRLWGPRLTLRSSSFIYYYKHKKEPHVRELIYKISINEDVLRLVCCASGRSSSTRGGSGLFSHGNHWFIATSWPRFDRSWVIVWSNAHFTLCFAVWFPWKGEEWGLIPSLPMICSFLWNLAFLLIQYYCCCVDCPKRWDCLPFLSFDEHVGSKKFAWGLLINVRKLGRPHFLTLYTWWARSSEEGYRLH